jgi:hypothetical protein
MLGYAQWQTTTTPTLGRLRQEDISLRPAWATQGLEKNKRGGKQMLH